MCMYDTRLFPLSSSWSHEQSGAQGLTQQKKKLKFAYVKGEEL